MFLLLPANLPNAFFQLCLVFTDTSPLPFGAVVGDVAGKSCVASSSSVAESCFINLSSSSKKGSNRALSSIYAGLENNAGADDVDGVTDDAGRRKGSEVEVRGLEGEVGLSGSESPGAVEGGS